MGVSPWNAACEPRKAPTGRYESTDPDFPSPRSTRWLAERTCSEFKPSANQSPERGDGNSRQGDSCRPVGAQGRLIHCIPWADAHGYILSPLRGWMAKHAACGAAKPGPVILILAA